MLLLTQDAALLVREGLRNLKFSTRPQGVWSTRSYAVVHHPVWYWLNFVTALALMALAVVEPPSVTPHGIKNPVSKSKIRNLSMSFDTLS